MTILSFNGKPIPVKTVYILKKGPGYSLNTLRQSDVYMRQQTRPSLFQIMACRLFGAKPLYEPMTK